MERINQLASAQPSALCPNHTLLPRVGLIPLYRSFSVCSPFPALGPSSSTGTKPTFLSLGILSTQSFLKVQKLWVESYLKYKGIHTIAEETASTPYIPMSPTKGCKLLLRVISIETKIDQDWSKPQAFCGPPGGGCLLPAHFLLGLAPLSEMSQFWGGVLSCRHRAQRSGNCKKINNSITNKPNLLDGWIHRTEVHKTSLPPTLSVLKHWWVLD